MKIYAINGSPRTGWNTSILCNYFLEGAASENVQTEIIHLSSLNYKGCTSCYACKRNGNTYGKCNVGDELYELLEKVSQADGIVLGSPIYFGEVTSLMRAFIERLLFPYNSYEAGWRKIAPKRLQTAMIYTMTTTKEGMERANFRPCLEYLERCIGNIFRPPAVMYSYDTYQFKDYGAYRAEVFDKVLKLKRREEFFPQDCQCAFDMGRNMAKGMQRI